MGLNPGYLLKSFLLYHFYHFAFKRDSISSIFHTILVITNESWKKVHKNKNQLFQKCFNPMLWKRSMMGLCFVYRCECTFLICIGTPLRITSYSMTYSLTWYYYIIQQKIWEKEILEIASNWLILLTSWTK